MGGGKGSKVNKMKREETRCEVPFLPEVLELVRRGTLPPKRGEKGTTGGPRWRTNKPFASLGGPFVRSPAKRSQKKKPKENNPKREAKREQPKKENPSYFTVVPTSASLERKSVLAPLTTPGPDPR